MTQQFNDVTLPKHGEHNVVSWGGIVCSISNRRSDQRRGRSCVSYGTAAFNQIAELHAAREGLHKSGQPVLATNPAN